jgi:hypothetical protein
LLGRIEADSGQFTEPSDIFWSQRHGDSTIGDDGFCEGALTACRRAGAAGVGAPAAIISADVCFAHQHTEYKARYNRSAVLGG